MKVPSLHPSPVTTEIYPNSQPECFVIADVRIYMRGCGEGNIFSEVVQEKMQHDASLVETVTTTVISFLDAVEHFSTFH